MSIPTVYGYMELSDGDDLGVDTVPECCGCDMTAEDLDDGKRDYTCEDCGTALTVSANGLVFEIIE